jgi:phosphoadenosine phosphosulfate reductase
MKENIEQWTKAIAELNLADALRYIAENVNGKVSFSTSLGQEDQVITHAIFTNDLAIEVFTLDTGRLFQETYDVLSSTTNKYKKEIKIYFPDTAAVEQLVTEKGPNSFYKSVENRKECCGIRKIQPLKRALKEVSVWVTGLRASQSDNRQSMHILEWDEGFGLIKFNPLIHWPLEEVEAYLKEYNVPQNALHKQGFVSIGCAPCTRAIMEGEDIRAGRWWWELSHKECGLHGS